MKQFNIIGILLISLCTITPSLSSESLDWPLFYHETFDTPFNEPSEWTEDVYGDTSQYHVGPFDEDGEFFQGTGSSFMTDLKKFRAFRKSFTYGKDGWLTVELYGRDSDNDGTPESGGTFESIQGKAKLVSQSHTDGAIITSTKKLPSRYRVEVTISNINFGGEINGSWTNGGKFNGYDGDERAGPWKPNNIYSTDENGVYFLCITDYARPAPHNNVFIHHHRKVVMDSDNNNDNGNSWSSVWNPNTQKFERDGSHYISMIWLNGEDFGSDYTGNTFVSYTPAGWEETAHFADKYLDGETYTFTIERDEDHYTMSVAGKCHYGGNTTYSGTRKFRDSPVTWHYNQSADEYQAPFFNQTKTYNGKSFDTWPEDSEYPDHFFFGDPHINYYEGTAEYDDLKLYLPDTTTSIKKSHKNKHIGLSQQPVLTKVIVSPDGALNLPVRTNFSFQSVVLYSLQGRRLGMLPASNSNGKVYMKETIAMAGQMVLVKVIK